MKRILILLLLAFVTSCKKSDTGTNTNPALIDQLTDTQIQSIEVAGIDTISTYSNALFPDGSNMSNWEARNDSGYVYIFSLRANPASDKKLLFINSMTHAGFKLTTRSNYTSYQMQNGIAYVYNSKSFINTSTYQGATCQEALHGLDCSGMIYQMAKASDLNLPSGGTVDYVKTTTWNTAFDNSPDFKGLTITDLNALASSDIQAGDIIVAPNNHIGMAFDNGSSLAIFNSLGTSKYSCTKNSDTHHGPVISKNLSNWLQSSFGSSYHVLRVVQKGTPGLTTANISSQSQTSAVSGGNITNDGGSPITARGVCWSTSSNPIISNSKTFEGTGTGTFESNITGLTANATYYVRAYATNSAGTGYGNVLSFTTSTAADFNLIGVGSRNQDIECGDELPPYTQPTCVNFIYACNVNLQVVNQIATGLADFGLGPVWSTTGTADKTSINLHCVRIDNIGHSTDLFEVIGSDTGVIDNGQHIFEGTYSRKWTSDADGSVLAHSKGHFKMKVGF